VANLDAIKGKQIPKYLGSPDINPGGKRAVVVLAPNVSELERAQFARKYGARAFGSIDHLHNHLRRIGACS
jgi:hypothetical protein